jgi:hypothetical protein
MDLKKSSNVMITLSAGYEPIITLMNKQLFQHEDDRQRLAVEK